jgi:hypothetical protein
MSGPTQFGTSALQRLANESFANHAMKLLLRGLMLLAGVASIGLANFPMFWVIYAIGLYREERRDPFTSHLIEFGSVYLSPGWAAMVCASTGAVMVLAGLAFCGLGIRRQHRDLI